MFRPEEAPEAHAAAGGLRGEDVISVSGELVRRDESAVNPELPTGEVELVVSELEQLADAQTPPFQIDEDDPVGEELRLRYRYLDLRKERMRDNVMLRHAVVKEIRDFLSDEGFLEIETPILTRSTPEGARDFLVPSRLMQRLLVRAAAVAAALQAAADDRRLRALLPDRALLPRRGLPRRPPARVHPARHGAVVRRGGGRPRHHRPAAAAVLALAGIEVSLPLERMTYDEVMLRYGSDRPDRRIGVEIVDLTDDLPRPASSRSSASAPAWSGR